MWVEDRGTFRQNVDDLSTKNERSVVEYLIRLDVVFGDGELSTVPEKLEERRKYCGKWYLAGSATSRPQSHGFRTPMRNMSIQSRSAWAENNAVIVPVLHSSHGTLRPGIPQRKSPSIASHFRKSQKLSVCSCCRFPQSYNLHPHSRT